jgi:membrane peptidoglycan carboxypeptidase
MYKEIISKESIEKKVEKIKEYDNYISISEVPETYKNATIAIEDHRFYSHGAIDVFTTARSFIENIRNKELSNGGSTITQQVARNMYFTQEKSFIRKVAELFVAVDLEKNYSKDEILEMYLNIIYFGDGYTGLKQASYGYYRKSPSKLSLAEQAMLAGIPNAPSIYSPNVNPELAKKRQQKVLDAMVKYGYISKAEANNISGVDL